MKCSEVKCKKCGQDAMQASLRGAYLKRVSPKGQKPIINECVPSCDHKHGGQNEGLLGAIRGS